MKLDCTPKLQPKNFSSTCKSSGQTNNKYDEEFLIDPGTKELFSSYFPHDQ